MTGGHRSRWRVVPARAAPVLLLLLAAACARPGPAPAPEPSAPAEPAPPSGAAEGDALPPRLRRALEREAPSRAPVRLEDPEGRFEAQVPATPVGMPDRREGRTVFRLDLGGGVPAECWVFHDEVDLAGGLRRLSQELLEAPAVSGHQIRAVDAGAIGPTPFLALDWVYGYERDGAPGVGLLKQRIASKAGRSVYCYHDELGYVRSFSRLFDSLVRSLESRDYDAPVSWYREVSRISLGGLAMGFATLELSRDPAGGVRAESRTARLIPTGPRSLVALDDYEIEVATVEGVLEHRAVAEVRNGEPRSRLELRALEEGGYRVAGRSRGRPVEAHLAPAVPLLSAFGQYRRVREALAAGGERVLAFPDWAPDVDPTGLVRVEMELGAPTPEGEAPAVLRVLRPEAQAGGSGASAVRVEARLDAQGSMLHGTIPLPEGQGALEVERIFVRGRP